MAETPSRKLAVMLHADGVGSTALVQLNESVAHERIQSAFRRFSSTINRYDGIAHEIRGDALVAEFARASDAVSAALAFQADNDTHNQTLSGNIRPNLRVGISMDEVVIADRTVTGAGVVLSQRLEQLAEPRCVVVQGSVVDTVPSRMPFDYEDYGAQQLKGFEKPTRAFGVTLKIGELVPSPESPSISTHELDLTRDEDDQPSPEVPEEPSIAVQPFTNMSGDLAPMIQNRCTGREK